MNRLEEIKLASFDRPVLLVLAADWYPPSRHAIGIAMGVHLTRSREFDIEVIHFGETEDGYADAIPLKINRAPTLILMKEGREMWRIEGPASADELAARLDPKAQA